MVIICDSILINMLTFYFPFTNNSVEDLDLPFEIYRNSRYRFTLDKISQEFIDKVFPNQKITKFDNGYSPSSTGSFHVIGATKDLLMGNSMLVTQAHPNTHRVESESKEEREKYGNSRDKVLDIVLLLTKISLTKHIILQDNHQHYGTGSLGNLRTPQNSTPKGSLTTEHLVQLKEYTSKYIVSDAKQLDLIFELLRNASINTYNSHSLKCSLLVIAIESFLFNFFKDNNTKHIDRENFGICLSKYFKDEQKDIYNSLHTKRSLYFHRGEGTFKAQDWSLLHEVCKVLICDFLDDSNIFKEKIKLSHDY